MMPPRGDEEMVRGSQGRKSSAPSDQVSFKSEAEKINDFRLEFFSSHFSDDAPSRLGRWGGDVEEGHCHVSWGAVVVVVQQKMWMNTTLSEDKNMIQRDQFFLSGKNMQNKPIGRKIIRWLFQVRSVSLLMCDFLSYLSFDNCTSRYNCSRLVAMILTIKLSNK